MRETPTHNNVHDSFNDFYTKLDGAVNRHAPKINTQTNKVEKQTLKL